jgi:succinoglycan biosynthesis protein ExoA
MSGAPTVTVLVPARNEQADIGSCIASIAAQDYPLDRMEVIIVDGGSSDRTADVADKALMESAIVAHRIVTNPVGTTPSNLNAGLAIA